MSGAVLTMADAGNGASKYSIGGVEISVTNPALAMDSFFALARSRHHGYVTVTSAHGIVEAQTDPRLREIINGASLTLPDGMPVSWIGRMKCGHTVERVPGAQFFRDLFSDPRARQVRHYFYGSQRETVDELLAVVKELAGPDAIAGYYIPPFRPVGAPEDDEVIAAINRARPDVVWVGLSTPKQEYWMANHVDKLPGTLLVGVGAAFDFLAGKLPRAPRSMQTMGLEWLYRLVQEPVRLWPRYKRVVPRMLALMCNEAIKTLTGKRR